MHAAMTLPPELEPLESMDTNVVRQVQARLDGVEREHGVRILHAIESGSRAWGFPSPDSDYDCRFIYVRPIVDYARLRPHRDVIETPLTPVLDVNGWDLRKALGLGLKGNAVLLEWLRSPIVYRAEPDVAERVAALLDAHVPPALVARHYVGLLHGFPLAPGGMRLKKLFYGLRPLAALEWMATRDFTRTPPMAFRMLIDDLGWAGELRAEIDRLIALKARTHELGEGPVPPAIAHAFERWPELAARTPPRVKVDDAAWTEADALLVELASRTG